MRNIQAFRGEVLETSKYHQPERCSVVCLTSDPCSVRETQFPWGLNVEFNTNFSIILQAGKGLEMCFLGLVFGQDVFFEASYINKMAANSHWRADLFGLETLKLISNILRISFNTRFQHKICKMGTKRLWVMCRCNMKGLQWVQVVSYRVVNLNHIYVRYGLWKRKNWRKCKIFVFVPDVSDTTWASLSVAGNNRILFRKVTSSAITSTVMRPVKVRAMSRLVR